MKHFRWILACLVLFGLFSFEKPKSPNTQPNILFVIADDWSYGHASIYGDNIIKTPNFDRVAREGALFDNAYCASPSCAPSRAAILTGQFPHRLQQGANLWGVLNKEYPNYTRILESQGYYVGLTRKGYGPGNFIAGGYDFNPAGKPNPDFATFFSKAPKDNPFCFWFGSTDPHREYESGSGKKSGMQPSKVQVPAWLPDFPIVRSDILDYYFEIQRLDRELGEILKILEDAGQLDNTIIVVTSDNGMPFPRAKATLYDSGVRMPLAIRWKGKIKPGQRIKEFVSLTDLAPTFLEAAGQKVPVQMTG
uniref:sulfatase family protein n=1 Tax=Daejeonella sp. TaxID=2805397 RepID=UPI0039835D9E